MKLPKRDEKFIVNMTYEGEECSFYGFVVSGVHIEIRGDDDGLDSIWYYVCADKVYALPGRHILQWPVGQQEPENRLWK